MSYVCNGYFDKNVSLSKIIELIELLGYIKMRNNFSSEGIIAEYFWSKQEDYQTFVGVELSISSNDDKIIVGTRSRAGRSYWELTHQNRTMKLLRDCCGGYFDGDAGRNRYWKPESGPPTARESGLYLSRWIFNNALIRPRLYLDNRKLEGEFAKPIPTGLNEFDEMNPRFFSNSLIIPYLIAIWEDYNKSSFIALLKYTKEREKIFKNIKITPNQIEAISKGRLTVENAIGENLSFQKPQIICENYKMIDEKLDIYSVLKKPYHRRRITLYESLEKFVDIRNEFVHTGRIDEIMTDEKIKRAIKDFEVASDRIYDRFGEYYGFIPNRYY